MGKFAKTTPPVITVTLLLVTFVFPGGQCLDMSGSRETTCFPIKNTVPFDANWLVSTKTWYYPLMSRYDLYHSGFYASERGCPDDLREDELYYKSCITFGSDGTQWVMNGFNGTKVFYSMEPVKGLEIFNVATASASKATGRGFEGTVYVTLTDEKTFVFTTMCNHDNQMTWGVISPFQELPEETVKLVYDHAESLGFQRKFFTGIRYDNCKFGTTDKKPPRSDEL